MKFLCANHRSGLLADPSGAKVYWERWIYQGFELLETHQWLEAIRFFGCAFELAEHLLPLPDRESFTEEVTAADRYMIAGHHLAESCGQGGRDDLELHFLLAVHYRLVAMAQNVRTGQAALKHNLLTSLKMLRRYCSNNGEFRGYQDCFSETQGHIVQLDRQFH